MDTSKSWREMKDLFQRHMLKYKLPRHLKEGPPVAPRRGAKKAEESKKKYLRAIYDYDSSSELELSIREGDILVLVAEDKGDGWTEVEMKGKVGSVPSNYVEVVDKS